MAYVQTIFPGFIPDGYFDNDNVEFIRDKVARVLNVDYKQHINIDRASVIRIMQRVLEERTDTIPMLNQRVIMYLVDEFRNYQGQLMKHMKWEENYIESQRLYDPTVERGPDLQMIKLSNRLGRDRVGGAVRFMFI